MVNIIAICLTGLIFQVPIDSDPVQEEKTCEDSFINLDPMPDTPKLYYWPEMWRGEQGWGDFQLGYWYKDSFLISWTVPSSEPEIGYPYRYGTIIGINDTIKVQVYFDNRSSQDFILYSQAPQTWFYPALYNPYVDVFSTPQLADTSIFSYRFEHWIDMKNGVITGRPDTIFTRALHDNVQPKGMIFSIWGISVGGFGEFRVILKPTAALPQGVRLIVDNPNNVFTLVTGQQPLDTLNAYAMIAGNALLRREFTLFNSYVNNMFARNSKCLPGWALRYAGYIAQGDTTNAKLALDSLQNHADNRLDPFIPDTSHETMYHRLWLKNYTRNYLYEAWRLRHPEEAKYVWPF